MVGIKKTPISSVRSKFKLVGKSEKNIGISSKFYYFFNCKEDWDSSSGFVSQQ